jgi:hypothetical protein
MSRTNSQPEAQKPCIFEGTDTVTQNRKVAVQRIVEVHDALELKHQANATTTATERIDSTSISSDRLSLDFNAVDLPNGEVRAFRYFLRKWDHNECPDPEFDHAVKASQLDFDEAAIKHFFRRIALWHESEEVLQAARQQMETRLKKDKKKEKDSVLGKLWLKERDSQEQNTHDELKAVTTREGLAQLLWTLMHDQTAPLAPELFAECTGAVKKMYGITS